MAVLLSCQVIVLLRHFESYWDDQQHETRYVFVTVGIRISIFIKTVFLLQRDHRCLFLYGSTDFGELSVCSGAAVTQAQTQDNCRFLYSLNLATCVSFYLGSLNGQKRGYL